MNFKNYLNLYFIDIVYRHFFDFKGRASRKVFWLFTLNVFVVNFIVGSISAGILSIMVSLFLFLPSLGLSVRRLHDINYSGWWVLIGCIPVFGVIAVFVFACLPGTEGENRFGPAIVETAAVEEEK